MNLSISEVTEILLAAAWRRWRLIVLPIILFSVLSVLAAFFWPRAYAARTLLMLQERQAADPLSMGAGVTREGRLKAEEIDTLLKSERVLTSSILDFNLGKKPLTAGEIEGEIKSLKKLIGVSVVGSEFIEIELKQSERVGIADKLSIIMTRFFERLLAREDSMKTAREFAREQRRRDVDASRAALKEWVSRANAAGAPLAPEGDVARLQAQYVTLEQKLMATAATVLPGSLNPDAVGAALADAIRASSASMRSASGDLHDTPRLRTLRDLEQQMESYRSVGIQMSNAMLAEATSIAQSLKTGTGPQKSAGAALYGEWESVDARYREALAQYDRHVESGKKGSGPSLTPFGLIAPDSIRIIDEPRDPALPTTSLLKILVACIGAGIGLGIGLAALAEQLDDRIYDVRGLDVLTGVEAIYRVPLIDADAIANADIGPVEEPSRVRDRLAVVAKI